MRLVKRLWPLFVLALVILTAGGVMAQATRQGDECVITADEVIQDNLFVLCRTLTIDGRVEGDLLGVASVANIKGTVTGDIYLIAGQFDLAGTAGENVNFIGPVLRVLPTARLEQPTSDLLSLSLSTTLDQGAVISGGVTGAGYEFTLDGAIAGSLYFVGGALNLNGSVGGDVNATVGSPSDTSFASWLNLFPPFWNARVQPPGLVMPESGQVAGHLRYTGPTEAVLNGQISGETVYTPVSLQPDLTQIIPEEQRGGRELGIFLGQAIQEALALAIIGLIGLAIANRPLQLPIRQMQARPLLSLGVGLPAFIAGILAILVVMVVGGLILYLLARLQLSGLTWAGSILLALTTLSSSGILAFVVVFITRVLVALFIGRLLVQVVVGDDGSQRITIISLIVGILVVALVVSLPGIGWIINWLTIFWGLGAIAVHFYFQLRPAYDRMPVHIYRSAEGLPPPPPPITSDSGNPPGMDNLPEDFRWWND
ncbi:MAG TPA: hypothetical protein VHO69_12665 [Phototrophicaceae bacterium]|nr:hypothetical protein [Phototrophicaceae bacterium]